MQANAFAEHIDRCKNALSALDAAPDAGAFERTSEFSLHFLTSTSGDSDYEKREKIKNLIEREIQTYESLCREVESLPDEPGGAPRLDQNRAHYLVFREAGRRGKQVGLANADVRSKGVVLLAGAGDDGLLWRWRKFNPGPVDLSGCDLSGLVFGQAHFDNAIMRNAKCQHTVFVNCSFNNAIADDADFTGAGFNIFIKMQGGHFNRCNFTNCTLAGVDVDERTQFEGAVFTGCKITKGTQFDSDESIAKLKNRLTEEQRQQLQKGGCFVATAACGNTQAWEVRTLRSFRDHLLIRCQAGRSFVALYNRASPPLADAIARSTVRRSLVRYGVVAPAALAARTALALVQGGRKD